MWLVHRFSVYKLCAQGMMGKPWSFNLVLSSTLVRDSETEAKTKKSAVTSPILHGLIILKQDSNSGLWLIVWCPFAKSQNLSRKSWPGWWAALAPWPLLLAWVLSCSAYGQLCFERCTEPLSMCLHDTHSPMALQHSPTGQGWFQVVSAIPSPKPPVCPLSLKSDANEF